MELQVASNNTWLIPYGHFISVEDTSSPEEEIRKGKTLQTKNDLRSLKTKCSWVWQEENGLPMFRRKRQLSSETIYISPGRLEEETVSESGSFLGFKTLE